MSKLVVANANRGGTELIESESDENLLDASQPVGVPTTLQEALALPLRDFARDRDGARPSPPASRAAIVLIADNVRKIEHYLDVCERDYSAAHERANDLERQRDAANAAMLELIVEKFPRVADIQQRIACVDAAMWVGERNCVLGETPEWRRLHVLEVQAREARGHANTLDPAAQGDWRRALGQQQNRIRELEETITWWETQARELGVSIPA